ncbi:MAG: alpha/beta fold hydrolase [Pseudoxanthomonas sp.]
MVTGDGLQRPRVLLIHGLLNGNLWLWRLALRLRSAGFEPEVFTYSSLVEGPQRAVPKLVQRLRQRPVEALVGHSLGGLIGLQALREAPELPVSRVVCLGSPLCGSQTARALHASGVGRVPMGRSGEALTSSGLGAWQGRAQVGVVAGNRSLGAGRLFSHFEEGSDGTVGLDETRIPGLADHVIVPASHSGLVFSAEAAAQAAHFLREGRFR